MDEATKKLVEEAEARAAKATGGVWKLWAMDVMSDVDGSSNIATAIPVARTCQVVDGKPRAFDADFIAHARTDIPALCAAVREQDKRARHAEAERDALGERIKKLEAERDRLSRETEAKSALIANLAAECERLEYELGSAYLDKMRQRYIGYCEPSTISAMATDTFPRTWLSS